MKKGSVNSLLEQSRNFCGFDGLVRSGLCNRFLFEIGVQTHGHFEVDRDDLTASGSDGHGELAVRHQGEAKLLQVSGSLVLDRFLYGGLQITLVSQSVN